MTNDITYRVAELFIRDRKSAPEVADQINKEFPGAGLTRVTAYPRLAEALARDFIRLQPPVEDNMARELERKFKCDHESIRVVDCPMPGSNEGVSFAAAEWALELVRGIAKRSYSSVVGLGLGPGGGTLDFARRFSQLIKEDANAPKLNLVAITAGGPTDQPQYASVSYFNLFSSANVDKRIGFFAETFMPRSDFDRLKREGRLGIKEAFEAKSLVNLVVTSMGDKEDPHALFRTFHDRSGHRHGKARDKTSWWNQCVGDCQYRPYSATGPIREAPGDLRAATLFELEELVQMARERKRRVLLIARPCFHCPPSTTRAKALLPLLTQDNLRVFSELVVDSGTARELLQDRIAGKY